jgi:hypothetical protein
MCSDLSPDYDEDEERGGELSVDVYMYVFLAFYMYLWSDMT